MYTITLKNGIPTGISVAGELNEKNLLFSEMHRPVFIIICGKNEIG